MGTIDARSGHSRPDKKISATIELWLIYVWMFRPRCPTVEVLARYMVLLVVVAVALGKGRTQNIAKAGTAV